MNQKNSIRLAEKIRSSGKNFLWLGYEPSPQSIENYTFSRKWQMLLILEAQNRFRTITLF